MIIFRRSALFVFLLGALLLGGCGSDTISSENDEAAAPEWLFSLKATGTSSFNADSHVLVIPTVAVLGFTDRPDRLNQELSPTEFASMWKQNSSDSFTADPPNISMTWWPAGGGYATGMRTAEIAGDVSYDPAAGLLTMRLDRDGSMPLQLPASLEQLSIFVDGFSTDCSNTPAGGATVTNGRGSQQICINGTQF